MVNTHPRHCASHSTVTLLLGHGDVGGVVGDGAGVLAVLESDLAGLAPAGAPGVSDDPVVVDLNTNSLDAVVDALAAHGHDAAGVGVELRGIQAHREGTGALDEGAHVGLTLDGGVAADGDDRGSGGSAVVALAGGSTGAGVRVRGFGGNAAVLLDVVVSMFSPSTTAAQT